MNSSEIKEVIYIAISAIVLSLVLGFISVVGTIQKDIATARNEDIIGRNNMIQCKKFSKYDKKELVGEEVIECIRMYYDSELTIYVGSGSIAHNTFNLEEYMKSGNRSYFTVDEGSILLNWFRNDKKYRSYLVYNSMDPEATYNYIMNEYGYTIESIVGTLEDKYKALDKIVGNPLVHSEVTGIIIIDVEEL